MLGAKRLTGRFRSRLADAACSDPWSDVASREAVSWWRVADAFDDRAQAVSVWTGKPPRVVSLDEASFKRGFVYHTVLSAPEQRRILELVEGRSRSSARQVLATMPFAWRASIQTVVIDLFWPFRHAIADVFGDQVRVVADKFHVLRSVDAAANKVRIRHGRKITVVGRDGGIARQHNPRFDRRVWNSRWLFMRRHRQLSADDQTGLDELFARHPEIGLAWLLKESFAEIYNAVDRTEAQHRLDLWVHHVEQSGLREFRNLWRILSHWQDEILNYHDDRQTNGYAEGVTNKIKVLKRRGYGHRHPHRYRAKVLLHTANHHTDPPPTA
jgi:transposase